MSLVYRCASSNIEAIYSEGDSDYQPTNPGVGMSKKSIKKLEDDAINEVKTAIEYLYSILDPLQRSEKVNKITAHLNEINRVVDVEKD